MSTPTNQPWREPIENEIDQQDWMYELLMKDEYDQHNNEAIGE